MQRIASVGMILCAAALGACKPAAPAPGNDAAANAVAPAEANVVETADDAAPAEGGDAVVGKWVDDENAVFAFAADGTISSTGEVTMTGSWKADGEGRYDVDLNSPAGPAKGLACIDGDTMAMVIGDGETTWLGRTGENGEPAKPDSSVKCA